MDACRERGITVCNCAGYSTAAVADLVFGLLIALYRNILSCDRVVRTCGTKDGLVGYELEGKKFGVVGTGAIGMRVAKIAQAFGCEVLAYSRTKKPESGLTYVSMEELLANSDIVSLHVPLTDATRGLIDHDAHFCPRLGALLPVDGAVSAQSLCQFPAHGDQLVIFIKILNGLRPVQRIVKSLFFRGKAIIFTFLVGFRYLFSEFQHLRDDFFISN